MNLIFLNKASTVYTHHKTIRLGNTSNAIRFDVTIQLRKYKNHKLSFLKLHSKNIPRVVS